MSLHVVDLFLWLPLKFLCGNRQCDGMTEYARLCDFDLLLLAELSLTDFLVVLHNSKPAVIYPKDKGYEISGYLYLFYFD